MSFKEAMFTCYDYTNLIRFEILIYLLTFMGILMVVICLILTYQFLKDFIQSINVNKTIHNCDQSNHEFEYYNEMYRYCIHCNHTEITNDGKTWEQKL